MLSILLVILPSLQNYHRGFQQVPKRPPRGVPEKQVNTFSPLDIIKHLIPEEILNEIPKEIFNGEVSSSQENKVIKNNKGTGRYMRIIQVVKPKFDIPSAFLYPELPSNSDHSKQNVENLKFYVRRSSPGVISSYSKRSLNAHQQNKYHHLLRKEIPLANNQVNKLSFFALNPAAQPFLTRLRSRHSLIGLDKHDHDDDDYYSGNSEPFYYCLVFQVFGYILLSFGFILIFICCRRMCCRVRSPSAGDEAYVPPVVNQPVQPVVNQPVPYPAGYYVFYP